MISIQPNVPDLDSKSLPKLPRGWTRLCHETSIFLRSIGLGIVVSTWSGLFDRHFKEPTKVAIRRSRVTALLKALIHVVPLAIGLAEIWTNCYGRFFGATFNEQPSFQVIAKAHEITIQASLALIVLSYIRYQATHEGLPFGTFLGGLQFLNVGYLWSPELWSLVISKGFRLREKLSVLALLIVCGILAPTVGPSSATLLIPRDISWPTKPSYFAVNGTFDEVWPDRLTSATIPDECAVLYTSDGSSVCPGGFFDDFAYLLQSIGVTFSEGPLNPTSITTQTYPDPVALVNKLGVAELCSSSPKDQVCGSTPQSVIIEGAYGSIIDWFNYPGFKKRFRDLDFAVQDNYYQPYTVTSCLSETVNETNQLDPIRFPQISETEAELSRDRTIAPLPGFTKAQALDASMNRTQFSLEWIELPETVYGEKTIGAIIVFPEVSRSVNSRNLTTCSLRAGWGSSAALLSFSLSSLFSSVVKGTPKQFPVDTISSSSIKAISQPNWGNISGYVFPQRRVTITKDWADLLNPTIVSPGGANMSAINLYLTASPEILVDLGPSRVLASMLTYGMANMGIELGFQQRKFLNQFCPESQLMKPAIRPSFQWLERS